MLPPTRSRDIAAAEYANTALALDPLRTARWIESVGDLEVRTMWTDFFYRRWLEKDPGTAETWGWKHWGPMGLEFSYPPA